VFVLISCGSKKGYLDRSNTDRALQDAVKKINKNPNDDEAKSAIPELYRLIKQKHLDRINAFSGSQIPNKWNELVAEYQHLQNAYDLIINSPSAFRLVTPESYNVRLLETKDSAAAFYYAIAQGFDQRNGRENAISAYQNYKTANGFVRGYKDINEKMQAAYNRTIINVVIYPVVDNSNYFKPGFVNFGNNYSNEYFQINLLSDLNNNNRYPARFYNKIEAQRLNMMADWVVGFRLKNLNIPDPSVTNNSRSVNKQIQIGTDTSGRPVYNTVYATINTQKSSFVAKANMEMIISEPAANRNISSHNYNEEYKWEQETATFSGDRRALSDNDWNIINNSGLNAPRKEEILVELYKKIYPSALFNIRNAVNW
jgi:hypothetical protein